MSPSTKESYCFVASRNLRVRSRIPNLVRGENTQPSEKEILGAESEYAIALL